MWGGFALLQTALFWLDGVPATRRWVGDEVMYAEAARRVAVGEPAALDLLWPPLYAWFLAPFTPLGTWAASTVAAAQVGLLALAAVALRGVVQRLTRSATAATLAQALLLLDPQVGAFAHYLWPEVLHLALFLCALWLLIARPGWWWWLGGGLALGAVCLSKSIFLPLVPLLLLALLRDLGWRRGALHALGVLIAAVAVVAPTLIANGRTHGVWAIADSSRFNLWVGLNTTSRRAADDTVAGREYARYLASGTTFAERQAALDSQLAAAWQSRGATAIVAAQLGKQPYRLLDKHSFFTEQLPGGRFAARGLGYRDALPALAASLRLWSFAVYALALAAGGLGLATTRLRGRPWLQLLWCIPAYGGLLFLALDAKSRFRIPLLPALYVAAGLALASRGGTIGGDALPATRRALGVVLAALLLWLAFADTLLA